MKAMKNFKYDYFASFGVNIQNVSLIKNLIKKHHIRFIFWGRLSSDSKNYFVKKISDFNRFLMRRKYGLEIFFNNIGPGFRIVHAYNITISSKAIIGKNNVIFKGVTIGETFRGIKKGAPHIGNCVWIGPNATIVGNISIGDDVLIAPNSFVNIDIPSHSVVLGNPAQVFFNKNATKDYITNILNEENFD